MGEEEQVLPTVPTLIEEPITSFLLQNKAIVLLLGGLLLTLS